jgi:hypothetical protein
LTLHKQLAHVFAHGLAQSPELASSLHDALDSQVGDSGQSYTKAEANYRPAEVDNERCGLCTHYSNNACDIVSGAINVSYVCDHFKAAKSGDQGGKDVSASDDSGTSGGGHADSQHSNSGSGADGSY